MFIPGHFRAFSGWFLLLVSLVSYFLTGKPRVFVGLVLIFIGAFLGDQATHLHQADHSALPPTALERWLQRYRLLAIGLGCVLAVVGCVIAFC